MSGLGQLFYFMAYVQKVLCSEGSMFRKYLFKRFYVQNVLYSAPMFRRSFVQKVLYSEGCSDGPMFRRYLFKRSYIQKVLCSTRSYIQICQNVLYSENPLFYVGKNVHLSVSGKLQCKITNGPAAKPLILL